MKSLNHARIPHATLFQKVFKARAVAANKSLYLLNVSMPLHLLQVSWNFALDRIATLIKQDRDANFIAKNAAGTTVNRWISTGMLAASASSTETAYLTAS